MTRWNTDESLKNGIMSGSFFETFVISEILKSYFNRGIANLPLYFYSDSGMNEIDLLIEEFGSLHPIEIKNTAKRDDDIKVFKVLDRKE